MVGCTPHSSEICSLATPVTAYHDLSGVLGFDNNRPHLSLTSATLASWVCDSPAPRACVPSKRVLMPTWADSCPGFGRVRIGHPLTSYRLLTYITRRPSAAPVNQPWVVPPVTMRDIRGAS